MSNWAYTYSLADNTHPSVAGTGKHRASTLWCCSTVNADEAPSAAQHSLVLAQEAQCEGHMGYLSRIFERWPELCGFPGAAYRHRTAATQKWFHPSAASVHPCHGEVLFNNGLWD